MRWRSVRFATADRQMWLKVPNPDRYVDWTHYDVAALWA